MGHQGSQPGLASSGVLVPPGGSGRPWALPGTNLSAGKHATHNLSQFISGKTSTTCCKISLRYQVMSSIIWLDYCSLLLRWHCWAKCMRHEVLKSSWVWYKRTLDSSFFFPACNQMLEFHTYLEGKSSHFDSSFSKNSNENPPPWSLEMITYNCVHSTVF